MNINLMLFGLALLVSYYIGVVKTCTEYKDPKPIRTARRSRRQKSGFAVAADVLKALERMDKRAYDIGVLRKPFYQPKRRKHRSAYKIFW